MIDGALFRDEPIRISDENFDSTPEFHLYDTPSQCSNHSSFLPLRLTLVRISLGTYKGTPFWYSP